MPFAISLIRSLPLALWYLSIDVAASAWRPHCMVSFRLAPVATAAVIEVARSVWKCKSGRPALTLAVLKWSRSLFGVMCVPSEHVTMKSVGRLPSHASLISFPSCGGTGWVVLLVAVFVVSVLVGGMADSQGLRFWIPVLHLETDHLPYSQI